jgi:NADPH2:quinone reductase
MNAPVTGISGTQTMKAITFANFGEAGVLNVSQVSRPEAKAGEVLIRISHTSVNPVDWKIRKGYLKDMLPHVFPIIPGWDAAGTIEAVGAGVSGFTVGERVAAYTRLPQVHSGTYAEYISLPVEFVAKISANLSFEQAAGVPLVALTAWQALSDYAKIKAGDKVLVLNGAGGVGSFAIQFARQMGANVTATTGSTNVEYVRSLGAHHVIDYSKESVTARAKDIAPDGFDFVFDAIGGESLKAAYDIARAGGQIVSIVDSPDAALAKARGVNATFHFVYPSGGQLLHIFTGLADGKTRIPEYRVLPVTEARAAHLGSETHRTRGKTILKIEF